MSILMMVIRTSLSPVLLQQRCPSIGSSRAMAIAVAHCSSSSNHRVVRVIDKSTGSHFSTATTITASSALGGGGVVGGDQLPIDLNGYIGFIGLGMMGAKMVQNLSQSLDQQLWVHDNNPVAVQSVVILQDNNNSNNNSDADDHDVSMQYHQHIMITTCLTTTTATSTIQHNYRPPPHPPHQQYHL